MGGYPLANTQSGSMQVQIQTGSSTTTTTMAYPALPASPTLTNPDMILPYGDYDSPPQHAFRPPSPGEEWRGSRPTDGQFSIGPPSHLLPITPTTPIIYGNGTMLSDIGEVTEAESTPGRRLPGPAERKMLKQQARANIPLRSSPTVGFNIASKRSKTGTHERKVSAESASTVTSEGQATEMFKDFDDGVSMDDSNFQGDDEQSVADSYTEGVIASETQRLARGGSAIKDEDQNSSAALSRRAEQILLNAKKRLNVSMRRHQNCDDTNVKVQNMEGNLTRARSTLYITSSSSLSSIHSSSPLSRSTPSPQENRRIVTQTSKPRQFQTHSESASASPGHARVYSENSISEQLRAAPVLVRSASAAARYMGRGAMEGNQRSPPSTSAEENAQQDSKHSGVSSPLGRPSPPRGGVYLEPLNEDGIVPPFEGDRTSIRSSMDEGYISPDGEPRGLTRSASSMQMRDLRDQMHDLKGRLSVLRDRARDDTMKRRSLQSLRTPSPFTAAEQWYAAAQAYTAPGLSADAGVGLSPSKDVTFKAIDHTLQGDLLDDMDQRGLAEYPDSEATSVYEDVSESHQATNILSNDHGSKISEEEENHNTATEADEEGEYPGDYDDELVNREEIDDYESDTSLYHDTQAISHEDREDAFDYEHFFLHSAMGTINQQRNGRRDSFSSEDSVETTRGPPAINSDRTSDVNPRTSLGHLRAESTDSVSTMATFATATEGLGSEQDGDEVLDTYAVQEVFSAPSRPAKPPVAGNTSDSPIVANGAAKDQSPEMESEVRPKTAICDPGERDSSSFHRPSVASFGSFSSTGTTRSFPLINKPKSQFSLAQKGAMDFSSSQGISLSEANTLVESGPNGERLQPSPVQMLVKDDQILVERLVASLGKCVLGLQESGRGSYEGRYWRRRLDAARRILEGEENA
jgi:hypothetical protein